MIYVFLDTNIYLKGRSGKELTDLTQDYFPHLVRHAQNGRLRLVMPAVTKAEIEAHVRIAADKCREAIQSIALPLHSDALSAYIRQLRKEYDPDAFVSEALIRLYKFWENTEYITLDVTEIDVEKLVKARCSDAPPCTGRKRSEYQDAFALQALENFRQTQTEPEDILAVVSHDGAFRSYVEALSPEIRVFRGMQELFDLWGRSNQEMIDLLNEGIHELPLEERICEQLANGDFSLTNRGTDLLQYEDLIAEIAADPQSGKKQLVITGYEVIDDGSALLSFEASAEVTFLGVSIPQFACGTDGDVSDVSYRTADVTGTVPLSGWTVIFGKFDADDNLEYVDDMDVLQFDSGLDTDLIDLSDADLDITYYDE